MDHFDPWPNWFMTRSVHDQIRSVLISPLWSMTTLVHDHFSTNFWTEVVMDRSGHGPNWSYTTDITDNITSDIRLFTDDCLMYMKIAGEDDFFQLQQDLNCLTDWESKWQMKFYYAKCHMMHISQLRRLHFSYKYAMNSHQLEEVDSYPYLGVEISANLWWNVLVDKAVKKSSQSLGMLRRNIAGCSRSTKELAYNCLVR